MAKMTLEELRKLREGAKAELERRDSTGKDIHVIVGMGTSGIASGAKKTLEAFIQYLQEFNVTNAVVRQTGSMGLDHAEPTVEIRMPGMPDTIYGRVTPEVAREIVRKHILGKTLVDGHVYDRPSNDIMG